MENVRYNHLNSFLKNKFGTRTLKICVSGGFTCPNRDGTKSTKGCLFCSASGSGDHLDLKASITSQIKSHLNSYRGQRAEKFIVYFQNYSNTYAPIEKLKQKYYEALNADSRIVGLAIATRPDCINKEVTSLLAEINKNHYVWVELGLQSAKTKTMKAMNLCYTKKDFKNATKLLHDRGIDVVCHVMVGLPGENEICNIKTIRFLNKLDITGIKIHSTYVEQGTRLAKMYTSGNYTPLSLEEYIKRLALMLTYLKPNVVVHRISGDGNKQTLLAPEWNLHKKLILNGLDKYLAEHNLYQGKHYKKRQPRFWLPFFYIYYSIPSSVKTSLILSAASSINSSVWVAV